MNKSKPLPLVILTAMILLLVGGAFYFLPPPGYVPVLMYHFIGTAQDADESKNFVSEESFKKHMEAIRGLGLRVISLDELYEIKTGQRKPKGREIAITFDDGNYSFHQIAFPILKQFKYPVTVFVVSESAKKQLYGSMSVEVIQKLLKHSWVRIGSHTQTHPFLTEMTATQVRGELAGSKKDLESLFELPINHIAYPYGIHDDQVQSIAREEGYHLGFTTSPSKMGKGGEGFFSIPRTKMTRSADNPIVLWVKLSGVYQYFKTLRHQIKIILSKSDLSQNSAISPKMELA